MSGFGPIFFSRRSLRGSRGPRARARGASAPSTSAGASAHGASAAGVRRTPHGRVDACYRLGPRGPEVRTADGEWLTAAEVEERLHRARNLVQAVDRLGVVEQIRRDAERSAVAAIFYRRLAATSLGPDGAGPLTIPAPSEAELAHARERLPAVWAAVRAACARR